MKYANFQESGERIGTALINDNLELMQSFFADYFLKAKAECAQHFQGQGEEWIRNYRQHLQQTFGDRLTKCEMNYTPEPDVALTPISFPKMAPPVGESVTKDDPLFMLKGHQTIFHLCAYYDSPKIMRWVLSDQFKRDYPMCVLPSLEDKNDGGFTPAVIAFRKKSDKVIAILKEKIPGLKDPSDLDDEKYMPGLARGFFK